MRILLDTSFLYAVNDAHDRNHIRSVQFTATLDALLILPVSVLPELCYLLHSRLGHSVMRRFVSGLTTSDIQLESINAADMERVAEILTVYADAELDFTDATIFALAERLNITRVLTFDRRDFSIMRPKHCEALELFP